jgi:hypothetical protein
MCANDATPWGLIILEAVATAADDHVGGRRLELLAFIYAVDMLMVQAATREPPLHLELAYAH